MKTELVWDWFFGMVRRLGFWIFVTNTPWYKPTLLFAPPLRLRPPLSHYRRRHPLLSAAAPPLLGIAAAPVVSQAQAKGGGPAFSLGDLQAGAKGLQQVEEPAAKKAEGKGADDDGSSALDALIGEGTARKCSALSPPRTARCS